MTSRRLRAQEVQHLGELVLAADEARGRADEVGVGDRQQRREPAPSELEQPHGLVEVLQPVLAEIGRSPAGQPVRGRAEQHLPAVPRGHDPRGQMDVEPDVLRRLGGRRTGVHAHPNEKPLSVRPLRSSESLLRFGRRKHCLAGVRERHEEGVALVVDLVAAMAVECLAQQASMQSE